MFEWKSIQYLMVNCFEKTCPEKIINTELNAQNHFQENREVDILNMFQILVLLNLKNINSVLGTNH